MTDPSLLLQGYTDLFTWWTGSLAQHWQAMSAKLQAGTYGPGDAVSDAAYCVALNTLGLLGAANETMEATGVLVFQPGPTITSAPGQATASSLVNRPTSIMGPFQALVGTGSIATSDLSVSPAILPAGQVDVQVYANATNAYASSYFGWVQIGTGQPSSDTEVVAVTLIVQ